MKCQVCNEPKSEKLTEFLGKMACKKCIEEFEEGIDVFELYSIAKSRGKKWIEQRLEELVGLRY